VVAAAGGEGDDVAADAPGGTEYGELHGPASILDVLVQF
jgi:hypothetical protein